MDETNWYLVNWIFQLGVFLIYPLIVAGATFDIQGRGVPFRVGVWLLSLPPAFIILLLVVAGVTLTTNPFVPTYQDDSLARAFGIAWWSEYKVVGPEFFVQLVLIGVTEIATLFACYKATSRVFRRLGTQMRHSRAVGNVAPRGGSSDSTF